MSQPAFSTGHRVLRNEFSWSLSRERVLRECARKYWFTHYGMWGGWDRRADPRTREIYLLRNLKTRRMWAGTVVHDAVRRSIRLLRNGQEVLPVEEIVRITLARMRADWVASRQGRNREDPKRNPGLLEHEYGLPVAGARWREVADQVTACLRNFYASPFFDRMKSLPPGRWLEVEDLRSFDLPFGGGNLRVWVQLDAAFRDEDGGIVIVDWKTGRSRESADDHRAQLTCYALYATRAFGVPVEKVRLVEFNLLANEVIQHRVSAMDIEAARAFIQGSVLDMRALLADPDENLALEEDFARTADPAPCRRCPFIRVCWSPGVGPSAPRKAGDAKGVLLPGGPAGVLPDRPHLTRVS
jgi:CRISPR/Cas system-associated exonuclease Cas4 (RecB family)